MCGNPVFTSGRLEVMYAQPTIHEDGGYAALACSNVSVRYLRPYSIPFSPSWPACTHTTSFSPFAPLAWVATCAPMFAIATQALYIALLLSHLSPQIIALFSRAHSHNVVVALRCVYHNKCFPPTRSRRPLRCVWED